MAVMKPLVASVLTIGDVVYDRNVTGDCSGALDGEKLFGALATDLEGQVITNVECADGMVEGLLRRAGYHGSYKDNTVVLYSVDNSTTPPTYKFASTVVKDKTLRLTQAKIADPVQPILTFAQVMKDIGTRVPILNSYSQKYWWRRGTSEPNGLPEHLYDALKGFVEEVSGDARGYHTEPGAIQALVRAYLPTAIQPYKSGTETCWHVNPSLQYWHGRVEKVDGLIKCTQDWSPNSDASYDRLAGALMAMILEQRKKDAAAAAAKARVRVPEPYQSSGSGRYVWYRGSQTSTPAAGVDDIVFEAIDGLTHTDGLGKSFPTREAAMEALVTAIAVVAEALKDFRYLPSGIENADMAAIAENCSFFWRCRDCPHEPHDVPTELFSRLTLGTHQCGHAHLRCYRTANVARVDLEKAMVKKYIADRKEVKTAEVVKEGSTFPLPAEWLLPKPSTFCVHTDASVPAAENKDLRIPINLMIPIDTLRAIIDKMVSVICKTKDGGRQLLAELTAMQSKVEKK